MTQRFVTEFLIAGATPPLAYVLLQAVFAEGIGPEAGMNTRFAYRAAQSTIILSAQAAALGWLLRDELEGAPPRRMGHTSPEFLIAWCAMPVMIHTIDEALTWSAGGSALRLPMLGVLLAGGCLWVLSAMAGITITRRLIWATATVVIWLAGYSVQFISFNGPTIFGMIIGLITGAVLLLTNRTAHSPAAVEPSAT